MRKSHKAVTEEKRNYINRLSLLLTSDYRSEVEKISYFVDGYDEYVKITYRGGHAVVIDVTANSCGAIYKVVGHAIYGKG